MPLRNAADAEGILVIGAPRSGTTLLRRLLDAHPAIDCPGETNVFAGCGRFLRSEDIAGGVGVGVLDGLGFAGFSKDDVLGRLRELAFSFHREHAQRNGKRRWAAKTAFDAFYLSEIEQLCGDEIAFVCIQRHGLDVACSLRDLCTENGGYLRELHEYIVRYPRELEAFGHAWVDLAAAVDAFVARHPDNALTIRYEDLTADPNATMTHVMGFLGEPWDADVTQRALASREGVGLGDWKTYSKKTVERSSVGRWRSLPDDMIRRLGAICNDTLAHCGYDPVEARPAPDEKDSRRRYQLGLLVQGLKKSDPGSK